MFCQVKRKDAHEARQGLDPRNDKHCGRQHHLSIRQPFSIDLGLGQRSDQVIGWTGATFRDLVCQKVRQFRECLVELRIAAPRFLIGRNRKDYLVTDFCRVAFGQP